MDEDRLRDEPTDDPAREPGPAAPSSPPEMTPESAPQMTPAPGGSGEMSSQTTNWAMGAHLSALSLLIGVPVGNVLGPLIVWLIKRAGDPFVERQAREALNFNISITIYWIILAAAGVLTFVLLIGILFLVAAGVLFISWLVLTILAAVRASRGEEYQYPLTLRFVR